MEMDDEELEQLVVEMIQEQLKCIKEGGVKGKLMWQEGLKVLQQSI